MCWGQGQWGVSHLPEVGRRLCGASAVAVGHDPLSLPRRTLCIQMSRRELECPSRSDLTIL